jgi:hypothetical protein
MTDEELIEIGETAVSVLGNDANDKLVELEDLLSEHSPADLRKKLERLEHLEDRLENIEDSIDFDHLRQILKDLKSALRAAENLRQALSDAEDGLRIWSTNLHAMLK